MTRDKFVTILKDIGLNKNQMHKFHALLEERHPDDHQAFLEWLNIPAGEISSIRAMVK